MNAELLMLIGGIVAFVLTLHWVRNRELREKYRRALHRLRHWSPPESGRILGLAVRTATLVQ